MQHKWRNPTAHLRTRSQRLPSPTAASGREWRAATRASRILPLWWDEWPVATKTSTPSLPLSSMPPPPAERRALTTSLPGHSTAPPARARAESKSPPAPPSPPASPPPPALPSSPLPLPCQRRDLQLSRKGLHQPLPLRRLPLT